MTLRLSAPDWCFYDKAGKPADYYRRLKDLGFTGVEMVAPERWPQARAAGLEIVNLSGPGMQAGFCDRQNHAALQAELRQTIALAAREGIDQVIVFSGNGPRQTRDAGWENCRLGLRPLVADAEKAGVTLVFEMLNGQNHAGYQGTDAEYGFALAEAFASPAFKVLYDIYHLQREGTDHRTALQGRLQYLAHLHLAAAPRRDSPVNDRETPHAQLVPWLLGEGYAGFWGLEFIPTGEVFAELTAARDWLRKLAA